MRPCRTERSVQGIFKTTELIKKYQAKIMKSKLSLCSFPAWFVIQNVSKSGCLPRRASDLFYTRVSLSPLSLLSLVQLKHKNNRTLLYTRAYKRGDTPGPTSPPPFGADEMKEQLLRVAECLHSHEEQLSSSGATVRKMEALRASSQSLLREHLE